MRLIIGYNDRTNDLIYTDSWGAGHEFKAVGLEQAIAATHALFVLEPVTR